MENWKPVKDFEELFEVSDLGNFRRKETKFILAQNFNHNGYKVVSTKPWGKGKTKCFRVHREVAKVFIENPQNKPHVNHKDGVKSNNCVHNLEWCTPQENSNHAKDNGLLRPLTGFDNKATKISDEEVEEIMIKHKNGLGSIRQLCREKGIGHGTVLRRHQNFTKKHFNSKVFY